METANRTLVWRLSGMSGLKMAGGAALALAGITSVMAMAGRAVDLSRQESTNTDQLLRGVGDLDKTFDDLRSRVRASGEGLGVLYTESAALSKQYAKSPTAPAAISAAMCVPVSAWRAVMA